MFSHAQTVLESAAQPMTADAHANGRAAPDEALMRPCTEYLPLPSGHSPRPPEKGFLMRESVVELVDDSAIEWRGDCPETATFQLTMAGKSKTTRS